MFMWKNFYCSLSPCMHYVILQHDKLKKAQGPKPGKLTSDQPLLMVQNRPRHQDVGMPDIWKLKRTGRYLEAFQAPPAVSTSGQEVARMNGKGMRDSPDSYRSQVYQKGKGGSNSEKVASCAV